jgi:hypothetical protein
MPSGVAADVSAKPSVVLLGRVPVDDTAYPAPARASAATAAATAAGRRRALNIVTLLR